MLNDLTILHSPVQKIEKFILKVKYGMRDRHCICKDLINKDIKKTSCKGKPFNFSIQTL